MIAFNQDPAGRYTNLIEEWRRIAAESGAGPVVALLYDLITCILIYCATRVGQARSGEIADPAPARGEDAAPLRQPEMVTVGAAVPQAGQMPAVEPRLPAEPRLPRAVVRGAKNASGPAPARQQRADDGAWPRASGPLWTMEAGALRFDSQKMGFKGGALACADRSGLATVAD